MTFLRVFLATMFIFAFSGLAFAYHTGIMHNDRIFVPLRGVVEELGGSVEWDGDNRKVTIQSGKLA